MKKKKNFLKILNLLHAHHKENCDAYTSLSNEKRIIKKNIYGLPIMPVELFKYFNLKSYNDQSDYKILKSSGTSGLQSKIYLDQKNALMQSVILKKLLNENISENKLPMVFIGNNFDNNNELTAKEAGILGFSTLAKEKIILEDFKKKQNLISLNNFLKKNIKEKKIIFGFTDKIWENLIDFNPKINLNKCIILHGGGWKKLEKYRIDNQEFKNILKSKYNVSKVINYYGLVEQVGSIFFECDYGYFHTSVYSDIIIRDKNLIDIGLKKKGLVHLISILPVSYPGISILTQDLGEIFYDGNCPCSKGGKSFKIYGRQKNAEVRGCSNVK